METRRRMETRTREAHADREKLLVALSSVLAAVLLTGTKVVVGFATGSLGILSEALHSGLDLLAALLTLFCRPRLRPPPRIRNTPMVTARWRISRHSPRRCCSWPPVSGSFGKRWSGSSSST